MFFIIVVFNIRINKKNCTTYNDAPSQKWTKIKTKMEIKWKYLASNDEIGRSDSARTKNNKFKVYKQYCLFIEHKITIHNALKVWLDHSLSLLRKLVASYFWPKNYVRYFLL